MQSPPHTSLLPLLGLPQTHTFLGLLTPDLELLLLQEVAVDPKCTPMGDASSMLHDGGTSGMFCH